LPRDTEETVAEPRWEPKSPELSALGPGVMLHQSTAGESDGH